MFGVRFLFRENNAAEGSLKHNGQEVKAVGHYSPYDAWSLGDGEDNVGADALKELKLTVKPEEWNYNRSSLSSSG